MKLLKLECTPLKLEYTPLKHLFTTNQHLVGNLPYLGIRTRLQNSINKNLPFCKIKVIFESTTRLSNFYRFKDRVSFNLRSNVVYKLSCGDRVSFNLRSNVVYKLSCGIQC